MGVEKVLWVAWGDSFVMEALGSAAMARILGSKLNLRVCVYGPNPCRMSIYEHAAKKWGIELIVRDDDGSAPDTRKWREAKAYAPCLFCDTDIVFFSDPALAPVGSTIRIFGLNESPIIDVHRKHDEVVSSIAPHLPIAAIPWYEIPFIEAWYGAGGKGSTYRFNTGLFWCPSSDAVGSWQIEMDRILQQAGGIACKCALGEHALTSLYLHGQIPEIEPGVWPTWGTKLLFWNDGPRSVRVLNDYHGEVMGLRCRYPVDALHAMHAEDHDNDRILLVLDDDARLLYRSRHNLDF